MPNFDCGIQTPHRDTRTKKRLGGKALLLIFIGARLTGAYTPSPANFVVDEVRATKPFGRSPERKTTSYSFHNEGQLKKNGPRILRPTSVTTSPATCFARKNSQGSVTHRIQRSFGRYSTGHALHRGCPLGSPPDFISPFTSSGKKRKITLSNHLTCIRFDRATKPENQKNDRRREESRERRE